MQRVSFHSRLEQVVVVAVVVVIVLLSFQSYVSRKRFSKRLKFFEDVVQGHFPWTDSIFDFLKEIN